MWQARTCQFSVSIKPKRLEQAVLLLLRWQMCFCHLGHSPRHSGPFLVHPPFQFYVMPQAASRYPVYPSDAPDYGFTKKKTDFTQHTKPVSTATRPFTTASQSHGRPSSNTVSHRSQLNEPVRDTTVGPTAPDSSRRRYYQQQGGNRGRTSRAKSGHGSKQRHQQDSWSHTK